MNYLSILIFIFLPRALILFLKLLTNWFENVFKEWLWLILGIIFAPYTLLWYSVVENLFYGVWGILQITILIFAIIVDLFSLSRLGKIEE